jgi:tetratricopeptide (TPR) repeat protein
MKLALAFGAALALAAPSLAGAPDPTELGLGYICGAERVSITPSPASMLNGVGAEHVAADTANPEAQAWFDEGIRLFHAFNHEEAKAAFAKAVALDSGCALCAWGQSLGLGQTLNYAVSAEQTAEALNVANHALTLAKPGDDKVRALIAALQTRYRPGVAKPEADKAFGQAMDALTRRWPTDGNIANVAVHALLIPGRADDFSGVPRAEEILKAELARSPDDVAAIHYYIHATEFAGHAGQALPYAQRLEGLAPGASHLVHMGAHTFMRVGRYEQAALVDARALKIDADVQKLMDRKGPLGEQRYYQHNFLFGLGGALMAGDGTLALRYADHAPVAFTEASPADKRTTVLSRRLVAYGRYAPQKALALAERPDDPRAVRIYRHYARGEALAAGGDAGGVRREAEAVEALRAEADKAKETGNVQIAQIARDVLFGRAAMLAGQPAEAESRFAAASAAQEKAFPVFDNFDPPPWWYPVRRSVAAAQLKAGRYAQAEAEARRSLKDWPQDALALKVLAEAEARQKAARSAREHLAQARQAWRGDLSKVPLDLI